MFQAEILPKSERNGPNNAESFGKQRTYEQTLGVKRWVSGAAEEPEKGVVKVAHTIKWGNFGQFSKFLNHCFLTKPIMFLNTCYLEHYDSPLHIENEKE